MCKAARPLVILRPAERDEGSRDRFFAELALRSFASLRKTYEGLRMTVLGMTLFFMLFSGCGTQWEKSFIRKRDKPAKPAQFETDTGMQKPYPQLYKEHFNLWLNWNRQLIQDLGANNKREMQDLRESRRHLESLKKYLQPSRADQAEPFLKEYDDLISRLRLNLTSKGEYGVIKRRLESIESRVSARFHPKKVKDLFLPTPVPINMLEYQGDEPIAPMPAVVKAEELKADSQGDDPANVSYEKFRALPL